MIALIPFTPRPREAKGTNKILPPNRYRSVMSGGAKGPLIICSRFRQLAMRRGRGARADGGGHYFIFVVAYPTPRTFPPNRPLKFNYREGI